MGGVIGPACPICRRMNKLCTEYSQKFAKYVKRGKTWEEAVFTILGLIFKHKHSVVRNLNKIKDCYLCPQSRGNKDN